MLHTLLLLFLLVGQVPYYGPDEGPRFTQPSQKFSGKIRVQVLVYDQPDLGGLVIEQATFNGQTISLQPPDLNGFRGGGSFAVDSGTYELAWSVSRQTQDWPRVLRHRKQIKVSPKDSWVQVTIQGDQASLL